ncbi:uncharacterized protein B0H18DRAFT_1010434 [Fomitopsis serialis]|uniref:uncharacterized protein n=1 Tax=Fomitopsis serialis TaxID=139415 RepID=UPI002007E0F2|nr:uncharacterized protein B0H18DRAFT_1010434 [Neoantrodia serialis]KAH9924849.1 hypothetical protein B0H18DRAFT_1010434 [Neoantrodia serialis]
MRTVRTQLGLRSTVAVSVFPCFSSLDCSVMMLCLVNVCERYGEPENELTQPRMLILSYCTCQLGVLSLTCAHL